MTVFNFLGSCNNFPDDVRKQVASAVLDTDIYTMASTGGASKEVSWAQVPNSRNVEILNSVPMCGTI